MDNVALWSERRGAWVALPAGPPMPSVWTTWGTSCAAATGSSVTGSLAEVKDVFALNGALFVELTEALVRA